MQVRKEQLELDMEQQTGSKWEKEYIKEVMTNLDSILKSRDITLSTTVRLVKVVIYGCESWTIKKAEC